jgi:hypothetical protein
MSTALEAVLAAEQQLPEDVGKSGPLGLLLIVVLLIAVAFLVRSMTGHLRKLPRSFEESDEASDVVVPDDISELDPPAAPGHELLETLRRAPLAIEGPREDDDRREGPAPRA